MVKAYIIVDIQNDYFPDGGFPLEEIHETSEKAADFLAFVRANPEEYIPIHVRHVFEAPGQPFFNKGTHGAEINDVVKPQGDEFIITKGEPNAFKGTDLDKILKEKNISEIIISGAMTNICIQGTARAGSELGYKVTVLKDAVTTRDWEFDGRLVNYKDVNASVWATLSFGYAEIVATDSLIN